MTSFATVTPTNMELTPMRVTFNSVDLGGTLGNVVVSMKYTKANILADQLGGTVIDRRVSGLEVTVATELTEVQNKDLWKVVFPHATETSTGTKAIDFKSAVGDGDLSNAHQLVLHPLSLADANVSGDYTFYKACAAAESAITYGPTEQNRMKMLWNVLPDTTVTPARFFRFGDTTI
jgi:hypothetical protein